MNYDKLNIIENDDAANLNLNVPSPIESIICRTFLEKGDFAKNSIELHNRVNNQNSDKIHIKRELKNLRNRSYYTCAS